MALKSAFQDLRSLTPDGILLFVTRTARIFAYGFLAVVLMLYLDQVGPTETQIGLLLTLTLVGDTFISLWITTNADRLGRRRMLIIGAILMVFAGILLAITRNFLLLLLAATIGVISSSGYLEDFWGENPVKRRADCSFGGDFLGNDRIGRQGGTNRG
jgi:MFS family permease